MSDWLVIWTDIFGRQHRDEFRSLEQAETFADAMIANNECESVTVSELPPMLPFAPLPF